MEKISQIAGVSRAPIFRVHHSSWGIIDNPPGLSRSRLNLDGLFGERCLSRARAPEKHDTDCLTDSSMLLVAKMDMSYQLEKRTTPGISGDSKSLLNPYAG